MFASARRGSRCARRILRYGARHGRVLSAGILFLLIAVLAWRNIIDPDFGIHMASGRWIAENTAVPRSDPFTYTVGDHAYVAYHWLFQLGLHETYEAAGATGIAAARAVLLLISALFLADILRMRRCSALAGTLVGLSAILASEWRYTIRPELCSWLLATATLWILERRRLGRRTALWMLPILQLLWINLHVYPIGLAIIASYTFAEIARSHTLRTPLLAWGGASLAALWVNPYGLEAIAHPLVLATRLGSENIFAQHIAELASPLSFAPDDRQPFTTGIQLAAYRLLLLAGIAALVSSVRRGRLADAALIAIFGTLSLLAVRNVALYAIVATPALCSAFDAAIGTSHAGQRRRSQRVLGQLLHGIALGYALLMVPRVISGTFYAEDRRPDRFRAELCRACLALDTADWLAGQPIRGRGFNNLAMGGTLAWRDPRRKIFIDARNEVTGEAFYAKYREAMQADRWPETQRTQNFDYVVLAHRGAPDARRLAARLAESADWRRVYVDGSGVIFVRTQGPNARIPRAMLPRGIGADERAERLAALSVDAGTRDCMLRWLWSTQPLPGPTYQLGSFLLSQGEFEHAERPLLLAAAASRDFWEPHFDLGVLYERMDLEGPARIAFANAAALWPTHPDLAPLRKDR